MTNSMIHTDALTKTFSVGKQTVEAVCGLDLTVDRGEMVALLGPNGAGKSTTLRMLTTLIAPTSGTATVAGYDVTSQPRLVRRAIGYIGQGNGAGHNQRARDELVGQGRAYGLDRRTAAARADELVESLGLTTLADRKVSALSGGQRRRLDIAMGLIHAPGLLFLDEPSTGLDPQNRANLQEHIVSLRKRYGTTVVLTTHYLDEADSLAERVVVIDHGRLVADASPARLKADHAGDRITLAFEEEVDAANAAARIRRGHEDAGLAHTGAQVVLTITSGAQLAPQLLVDLQGAGLRVRSVEVARPTLDDVFLNLTGRSLRDEGATAPQPSASTAETDPIGVPA
ncbi:MAG: ABC transporter ATP-binding protein [Nocardioides sp.]